IDDHLSDLAHHYSCSSNVEKATEYLERAARQAWNRSALKEAELYLQRAIAALSTTPETPQHLEREFTFQLWLVSLLSVTSGWTMGETEEAVKRLEQLSERLKQVNDRIPNSDRLLFTLGATWGPIFERGKLSLAQRIADQMLEIAERTGNN